jgi:hypothetical protein
MNGGLYFGLKFIVSGLLIAFASWLAGRRPVLAGFVIALPLTSILAMLFSYMEFRSMEKLNQFAVSIFAAVPLSLLFFTSFLLNRWLKWGFAASMATGLTLLFLAFLLHRFIFK